MSCQKATRAGNLGPPCGAPAPYQVFVDMFPGCPHWFDACGTHAQLAVMTGRAFDWRLNAPLALPEGTYRNPDVPEPPAPTLAEIAKMVEEIRKTAPPEEPCRPYTFLPKPGLVVGIDPGVGESKTVIARRHPDGRLELEELP